MASNNEIIKKTIQKVGKSFNPELFRDLMEAFEDEIVNFEEESKSLRVQGAPSEAQSIELAGFVKKLNNSIDKARLDAKRPYLDFGKELDSIVRPVQKRLNTIEKAEKSKCKKYRTKLLQEQREAEALKAKQEAEEAKKKTKLAGLKTTKDVVVKPAAGKVDTFEGSSASYKSVYVPYLEDITKVPAKYLAVDWKLVKADVKAGIHKIPGFDIREEADMTLRG